VIFPHSGGRFAAALLVLRCLWMESAAGGGDLLLATADGIGGRGCCGTNSSTLTPMSTTRNSLHRSTR
jgi:hypothetical protein